MDAITSRRKSGTWLIALGVVLVIVAGLTGWYSARLQSDPAARFAATDRKAIEAVVRDYILENPEILPEAIENLQRKQNAGQLAGIKSEVEKPFPGAVLGNPDGTVSLVEFSDYACGYCRHSVEDVRQLIANNPDLRVIVREFPILSPASADAARMALAAAEQGKFAAFHDAMFAVGQPSPETIDAAARKAGLDMAKAKKAITSPRIEAEIKRNLEMASQLGFNGTPSWIAGDQLISGAVGVEELSQAIAKAKS